MKIKIQDKYVIRHEILRHLYSKIIFNNDDIPDIRPAILSLDELVNLIKEFGRQQIIDAHIGIPHDQAKCEMFNDKHCMRMHNEGLDAYLDEYWLRFGEAETLQKMQLVSNINNPKWQTGIFALTLVVAIVSAYFTWENNVKNAALENRVGLLEKQKDTLIMQPKITVTLNPDTTKFH